MGANEPGAIWIPNTNHWWGRQGQQPRFLILHGTAGGSSAQGIGYYFQSTQNTSNPVSAHYIIGIDGTIVQTVDEGDAAYANGVLEPGHDPWWSACNPNLPTISIEHCKRSDDNSDVLYPAQRLASFRLIKHICERHGIPQQYANPAGGIIGHYSISPESRNRCPGTYPWDELWFYLKQPTIHAMVRKEPVMQVPEGWKDDAKTLTTPSGVPVVRGFRDHILNDSDWDANNWALEPEEAASNLEMSNPKIGAGTRQRFRMGQLEWTNARGVFECWIGCELQAYAAALATAKADLLNAQVTIASLKQEPHK